MNLFSTFELEARNLITSSEFLITNFADELTLIFVGQLKCDFHHPLVGCNGPSDFARTSASAAQKQMPNTQTQLER